MPTNSVDPGTKKWINVQGKRQNDLDLYTVMAPYFFEKQHVRIASFPADAWIFERGIIDRVEDTTIEFHGIERHPDVFARSKRAMRRLQKQYQNHTFHMSAKPSALWEYMYKDTGQFDIIYADWMGTWSAEKRDEVVNLFVHNKFAAASLFIFTIMLGRGQPKTIEELHTMCDQSYISFPFHSHRMNENFAAKTRGLANLIYSIALEHGRIADILYFGEYVGDTTPELSFAFSIQ